ncbi:MAG: aldo/keto reductase [Bdellovibrionaceae bacterium]|nr:aldo/keto reductase [Pseudobdellovibrionaceae bacterium]
MKTRKLGNPDIQIAPIVFGGNVFGWTIDEKKSFEVLDAFVDAGFNCIDTADVYSRWAPGNQGGESEAIIGRWMASRKNRDRIVIATKVGMEMPDGKGLSKDRIAMAMEASLKRLQTNYVDLYQAHADDESTSLEESLAAFEKIQKAGKARVIGASNYKGARLQKALETAEKAGFSGYRTFQPQYNLYDREGFEKDQEAVCVKNDLSVITYSSLASGFLTGKYRGTADAAKSPRGEGVRNRYLNERGTRILRALDEVSEEVRGTPAQVALAWLLHRPSVTAPIVSATNVDQLRDIVKAVEIRLDTGHLEKLNKASAG